MSQLKSLVFLSSFLCLLKVGDMWDCLMLDCSQSGKNSFIFLAFSNRSDAKLYIYVTIK